MITCYAKLVPSFKSCIYHSDQNHKKNLLLRFESEIKNITSQLKIAKEDLTRNKRLLQSNSISVRDFEIKENYLKQKQYDSLDAVQRFQTEINSIEEHLEAELQEILD